jgi:hypothetical protein
VNWLWAFQGRRSDLPDFSGKFVAIRCASERGGGVFADVKMVLLGYSHFVVGREVRSEPPHLEAGKSATCWFGINEISQMYVCDDIETAWERYERIVRYPWLPQEPDAPGFE